MNTDEFDLKQIKPHVTKFFISMGLSYKSPSVFILLARFGSNYIPAAICVKKIQDN
jgi:hypothetical protein